MNLVKIKKIIFHPLLIVGIIIASLHIFNVTRYEFIADKDSYGWILMYDNLQDNSIYFYRQLFSALIFTLHYLTGLDLFKIFKYLFPFFSLCVLMPLWLVARKLSDKKFQTLILLAAAASPTIIIQFEGTRPQVMAMLYLYFMLGISIIAFDKKNYNWLYGILLPLTAVSSLFHRVFAIFLVLWAIAAAYTYRKFIYKNKLRVVILLGLLYPWLDKLEAKSAIFAIFNSLYDIFQRLVHFSLNLKFPAYYINVDGKQMGWSNLEGVLKYYAFYTGPFLGILILLCLYFFVTSKKTRKFVKNTFDVEYFLPIYLFIAFFIFIAEFLPRFGNIAYLPDRAWIFLGILLVLPLFKLFLAIEKNISPNKKNIIFLIFFVGFLISISGAVYMNNQFSYIVPQYEVDSFKWIKNNLEPNRVIFYYGWQSLLRYHSDTPVIGIKKELLNQASLPLLLKTLSFKDTSGISDETLKAKIDDVESSFNELKDMVKYDFNRRNLLSIVKQINVKTTQLISSLRTNNTGLEGPVTAYIYYVKDSEKNPYRERMYRTGYSADISTNDLSVLDENPQYFQKVYNTKDAKIWRYIPNED